MSNTSAPPLPKLPQNPLGDAPDLPDSPLGHPPTSPLRVGRHGSLTGPLGRRAPRPPHVGTTQREQEQQQRNKPVVVQVKQAAPAAASPPTVAKEHERLPGKPVSARAREAAAAMKGPAEPATSAAPAEHKRSVRERLSGLRPRRKQGGVVPAEPQHHLTAEQREEFRRAAEAGKQRRIQNTADAIREFHEGEQ